MFLLHELLSGNGWEKWEIWGNERDSEMNKEAISDLLASSDKAMKALLLLEAGTAGDGCARALPP